MEDHVVSVSGGSKGKEKKKAFFASVNFRKNTFWVYLTSGAIVLVFAAFAFGFKFSARKQNLKVTSPTASTQNPAQLQVNPNSKCDLDVDLLVDISGSMARLVNGRSKLDYAKEAGNAFITEMETAAANTINKIRVGVSSFGMQYSSPYNSGKIRQPLTYDYSLARVALNSLTTTLQNGYGTCIECGLKASYGNIFSNVEDPDRQKVVILISDGYGNRTMSSGNTAVSLSTARTAAIAEANRGKGAMIFYYVVGYGGDGTVYDRATLEGVANDPDSDYYSYRPNVEQWVETFRGLATKLCQPKIPDCSNLTADKDLNNLRVGETVNFSVTASGTAPVTNVAAWVYKSPHSCQDSERLYVQYPFPPANGVGTYPAGTWTPTASQAGPFEVWASVWNDGVAECRTDCVDGPPRYLCPSAEGSGSVCRLSGYVHTPTPTPTFTPTPTQPQQRYCPTFKVNTIKDAPFGNPRQCNGTVDLSCNTDRVSSFTYSYTVDYRDAAGVSQPSLRQTGRVVSANGDLCSTPQNLGYSPEVVLSNMPPGGSATITLTYVYDPSTTRVLATTNPNTPGTTDDVIVVNVRDGQSAAVRGHVCNPGICGTACNTYPQQQPTVTVSTSTRLCN